MRSVRERMVGLGGASVMGLMMLLAFLPTRDAPRSGQLVFLPRHAATERGALPASNGGKPSVELLIHSCLVGTDGQLVVAGRYTGPAVEGEPSYVLATSGDPRDPGVRVGRDDLRDQIPFGEPPPDGSFRVPLPWADIASRFVPVVGGDGPGGSAGQVTTCP